MRAVTFDLKKTDLTLLVLAAIIVLLSVMMFGLNRYFYRFPGLFYFDPGILACGILLVMVRLGLMLQFDLGHDHVLINLLKEASTYALIIVVIFFGTSAVQYTPFHPVDKKIIAIEHFFHLDLKASLAWLSANRMIKVVANVIYDSLSYQLLFIPMAALLWRKYDALYQFYFLVLLTWLLGSLLYYFFPTMGPASAIDSPYFVTAQRDTGLKFWQLHHYIQPVTADGGMIAMPSFHVIWAWLCVLLLRPWPLLFGLLGAVNVVLAVSCVFLGWHYFLDVFASILVLLLSHLVYQACHNNAAGGVGWTKKPKATCPPVQNLTDSHPL